MAEKPHVSRKGKSDKLFQIWLKSLEPISRFVATHGLAVFLVVFYAVYLYPQVYEERGKWLKELTELRNAIDPENRSISKEQASAIIDLQLRLVSEKLKSTFGSWRTFLRADLYEYGEEIIVRLEGTFGIGDPPEVKVSRLAFSDREAGGSNKGIEDFKKRMSATINDALKPDEDQLSEQLIDLDQNFRLMSARLERFKYRNELLSDIWTRVYEVQYKKFSEDFLSSSKAESRKTLISTVENFFAQRNLELHLEEPPPTQSIGELILNFKNATGTELRSALDR